MDSKKEAEEHRKRRLKRREAERKELLIEETSAVRIAAGDDVCTLGGVFEECSTLSSPAFVNWSPVLPTIDPGGNAKGQRKRDQVEVALQGLKCLLGSSLSKGLRPRVVCLGSGSGVLVLPLAFLLSGAVFTACDPKAYSLELMQQRALAVRRDTHRWVNR